MAVTFNTIRLQILTRRDEIEVSKLIGATDGFIRRPFLYFGGLQGWPAVPPPGCSSALGLLVLNAPAAPTLAALYGLPLQLGRLAPGDSLAALLVAGAPGLARRLAVGGRHLQRLQSSITNCF